MQQCLIRFNTLEFAHRRPRFRQLGQATVLETIVGENVLLRIVLRRRLCASFRIDWIQVGALFVRRLRILQDVLQTVSVAFESKRKGSQHQIEIANGSG